MTQQIFTPLLFFINIEDSSGNVVGDGPITTALYWRQTKSLDRAGTFECEVPLADRQVQAGEVAEKAILRCFAYIEGADAQEIGSGRIDKLKYGFGARGASVVVSGYDLLVELAERTVQFLALGSTTTVTHSTAVSSVETYSPAGWSFIADGSPPVSDIIYRFAGESVLAACGILAKYHRTHFKLTDTRELTFDSSFSDSGLVVVAAPLIGNAQDTLPDVGYITNFSYTKDANDIFTQVYPYGGWYDGVSSDFFIGIGDINLGYTDGVDAEYWATSPISGFTHDTGLNYIRNSTAYATYGLIERQLQFPEIKVTFFTGGYSDDVWRELNRLIYYRAVNELLTHDRVKEHYELSLTHTDTIVEPGTTVRVIINHIESEGVLITINEDLIVLESTIEITGSGARTTHLNVSNVETYRRLDPFVTVDFRNRYFNDQYT